MRKFKEVWDLHDQGAEIHGAFLSEHGLTCYYFFHGLHVGTAYRLKSGDTGWKPFVVQQMKAPFLVSCLGYYLEDRCVDADAAHMAVLAQVLKPLYEARAIVKGIDRS